MKIDNLVGTVVCGGVSSRMGTDKAALPCPTGGTNLSLALNRLAPLCNTLIIAGRDHIPAHATTNFLHARVRNLLALPDPKPNCGPLAGVLAALRHAHAIHAAGVLVTPVDMPHLTTTNLQELLAKYFLNPKIPTVANLDHDRLQPLVAIYPTSALDALEQVFLTSHRSLNRWLQSRSHQTIQLPPKSAANMNTPDDLHPIERLAQDLSLLPCETVPLANANGRILRSPIVADRDSPAANVSAMDGYAIRLNDAVAGKTLKVTGTSRPGFAPPVCSGSEVAIQIFTGSVVPDECQVVVKREDVDELKSSADATEVQHIVLGKISYNSGMNIRMRGENSASGNVVVSPRTQLHPGHIAAAANFGAAHLEVTRQLRVSILVTGDELQAVNDAVQPWQLRDSNGPTLQSLLSDETWISIISTKRAPDDYQQLVQQIRASLECCDALLLTGGVSMGDFDFVPRATTEAGARQVFHKLPIRPGKPIFGAVGPAGQLVLGLPGNPVSAAVGTVRFAKPLLRKLAGCDAWLPPRPLIQLHQAGEKTLPLTWFRLVQVAADGRCTPTPSLGSGDLVSMAASEGFVEIPPLQSGSGPWPFWKWDD